jgi:hypothetical protein
MIINAKVKARLFKLMNEQQNLAFMYPSYSIIEDNSLNEKLSKELGIYTDSPEFEVVDLAFKFNWRVQKWMVKYL